MKRIITSAAAILLGGCTVVTVDEHNVFARVPFDARLAAATGETIEGEKAFASAAAWDARWKKLIGEGLLSAPTPPFIPSKVEHGVAEGGIAWSLISREGANRPLIVRCGGNASTRQYSGFIYAVRPVEVGDVMLFDYPGSGETGGEVSTERFATMMGELTALVHAKAQGRKLVLWGHSLGGFVCSELARRLPETDGVVLETTARNAAEVAKSWTPWFAGPFVQVKIGKGMDAYDNARALKDFKGPVLVLGAAKDQTLPVELSRSMVKALEREGVNVTYVEFPDGEHTTLGAQPGIKEAVGPFFDKVKAAR